MTKRIYLDYASLTPIDPKVSAEMKKYSAPEYANPSSLYKEGVLAKDALMSARKSIAGFLHALPDEITFTSGGTEANNFALIGAVESLHEKGVEYSNMRILISAIEHSSVRECANYLNGKGVAIDVAEVDKYGIVSLEDIKKKIKANTVIVSVMTVNNEVGTIQPIREIAKIIRRFRATTSPRPLGDSSVPSFREPKVGTLLSPADVAGGILSSFNFQSFQYPIFHTDAAQAALYVDLNVQQLGVDLLTLDGSKVYGPRGIGMLFIRRETPISPILFGGGQEREMRSGTENLLAIMGFAKALDIIDKEKGDYSKSGKARSDSPNRPGEKKEDEHIQSLKDYFLEGLRKIRPDLIVNPPKIVSRQGEHVSRTPSKDDKKVVTFQHEQKTQSPHVAPHILNVSIPRINNEFFILQLDANGISCSTKSSCLRDEDESYVLKSMGADSLTSIRFSFGRGTDKDQLKKALRTIKTILNG